jgi:hypothetical protein
MNYKINTIKEIKYFKKIKNTTEPQEIPIEYLYLKENITDINSIIKETKKQIKQSKYEPINAYKQSEKIILEKENKKAIRDVIVYGKSTVNIKLIENINKKSKEKKLQLKTKKNKSKKQLYNMLDVTLKLFENYKKIKQSHQKYK